MAKASASVAGIAVLFAISCGSELGTDRLEESHSWAQKEAASVRLELTSHDVRVVVTPGDVVTLTTELVAPAGSPRSAQRWLEANTPLVEKGPAGIQVRTPPRSRRGFRVSGLTRRVARVTINAPAECSLDISTVSGDVTVEGIPSLARPMRVRTVSGDLQVRGGVQELIFRSASGDVRVDGGRLDLLEAKTASGDIRLQSGAHRVMVDSASGNVRLNGLTGTVSARTASGHVALNWDSFPGGQRVTVRSSSGNVDVLLPSGPLQGVATTRSGRLRSNIPGETDARRRTATFSGPGEAAHMDISSVSGDIRLRLSH